MAAAAANRLAILRSHLHPSTDDRSSSASPPITVSAARSDGSQKGCSEADDPSCIFCSIVRGDSPAIKIYEDDLCLCILDSHPLTPGHCLIIPRSHFSCLEVTPPLVVAGMCSRVPFLSKAIMKATDCDSFNLLVNNGAAAGQVIFHTHLHVIPRRHDDKLWTSESIKRKSLKVNRKSAIIAKLIREQLSIPLKTVDCCGNQETKLSPSSQS